MESLVISIGNIDFISFSKSSVFCCLKEGFLLVMTSNLPDINLDVQYHELQDIDDIGCTNKLMGCYMMVYGIFIQIKNLDIAEIYVQINIIFQDKHCNIKF